MGLNWIDMSNLTIKGLDDILIDYLKHTNTYVFKSLDYYNVIGTNIEIIWKDFNNVKNELHIDLTTLLIYANTRVIEDRDRIESLERRLDDISDIVYRLDKY